MVVDQEVCREKKLLLCLSQNLCVYVCVGVGVRACVCVCCFYMMNHVAYPSVLQLQQLSQGAQR